MAKKYSYYSRPKSNRRRWALVIVIVITVGLAVWSLFFRAKGNISSNKTDSQGKNSLLAVKQPPEITLPHASGSSGKNIRQGDNIDTPRAPANASVLAHTGIDAQNGTNTNNTGSINPEIVRTASNTKSQSTLQAQQLFAQGSAAMKAGDYITAREKLSAAVAMGLNKTQDKQARDLLNKAADKWLFSPNIYSGDTLCSRYRVDTNLANIGKKFAVPYQLLARINGIKNPNRIAAGRTIKVVQGPFNVVVNRSRFLMSVYLGNILVRSYPITTGLPGRETPTGLWEVELKQKNPEWTDPDTHKKYLPNDPRNPLGERWIRLKGLQGDAVGRTGIGIHGTIKPEEICTQASRGCIRLLNKDVEELYDMLVVKKSKVTITK